jgi:AcrR family transcriptional regulator
VTDAEPARAAGRSAMRDQVVARSLRAARSRAEQRVQRFLDAGFELVDEKGTTDFTIQEIIDRSKQSLRCFYQYFDGKDELLLALFEETVREATDDLRGVVEGQSTPLGRLEAFTLRLHEWCDPSDKERRRGTHNRRPISEFAVHLASDHPDRVQAALAPISLLLLQLVEDAAAAGAVDVDDPRRAAALVQQAVMFSWFGNRLARRPGLRISAVETWEFCRRGLGA